MIRLGHWSEADPAVWRWPHFKPAELASKGDGSLVIVVEALDMLEAVRLHLARPLVVLSAYRDPIHNARVGGAPLSRHKLGDAFDVRLQGFSGEALLAAARAIGFRGFGFYRTFLHFDARPRPASWYGPGGKETWTSRPTP